MKWLNGWRCLDKRTVLVGTMVHCVGCGWEYGLTCVAFPYGWKAPGPMPDWPFPEDQCLIHPGDDKVKSEFDSWPPRAVELYKRVKALELEIATLSPPAAK